MRDWSRRCLEAIIFIAALACSTGVFAQNTLENQPQNTSQSVLQKRYQACTTCHGAGATASVSRSSNEMVFPRIAGKPALYLFNQLRNFRDGRRHSGLMVGLVAHQSDAALLEMARYFSQLDLSYTEPQALRAGTTAEQLQRGKTLALQGDSAKKIPSCAACHGVDLLGGKPAIPALLGLPRDYLSAQIGAWQNGQRRANAPDCMAQVAKNLSAEDVSAVVAWMAAQPVSNAKRSLPLVSELKAPLSLPLPLPMPCGGLQ